VAFIPEVAYFKPAGIPLGVLEEVGLTVEEVETIRLKDLESLEEEVAKMLGGYGWPYGPPGWGWGRGWGHGWGPGWGRAYGAGPWYGLVPYSPGIWGAAPTVEDEVAFLKDEAESLRSYLEGIERRISELEKTSG
jgi:hypothetical protein